MKTHILFAFLALVITACASKENQSASKFEQRQQIQDEYSFNHIDPTARFR